MKSDEIGSNWSKKDQDESDWLFGSTQIKLVQIWKNLIKLAPVGSKWFKFVEISWNWINKDQNESDWLFESIKKDKTGSNCIYSDIQLGVKIKIGSN